MRRLLFLAALSASGLLAQSLTNVTDTIVLPNGTMPSGTLTLSWAAFLNGSHQQVPAGRITVPVTTGAFTVNLNPTDVALPVGACYTAAWALATVQPYTRTWNVPTSASPLGLNVVQSDTRCAPIPGAAIALAQLTNSGATLNQCITWGGTYWLPGTCGSGGGGSPGGINGQVQYNNLGSFGGFTVGGDCTMAIPGTFNCTKTGGVPFAPSATTDTTNASNISSGTLAGARISAINLASSGNGGVTGTLPVANGGSGTAATLTGILRGGSPFTGSELSGDATTSGSNAVTVVKINGVTVSGTPAAGQVIVASSTSAASWSSAGAGTVTHSAGPLTAGALIIGNGSGDVIALSSLGTATSVYHGNVGGTGSFSAVALATDVSGVLPTTSGGTGTGSNFTNHFFLGNSTGSGAAPVPVQPTFADLAAGTVGAVATFPGGDLFCGGVNAQSGATYTIVAGDECSLTTYNRGTAIAVTLPQAGTAGFANRAYFYQFNRGAGAVTITPTTSTINGGATIVLNQNQGALVMSDGANYSAWVSAAPTGSGTVTSIATTSPITGGTITTTGTIACAACVTSAAALTANQLVIGGGSQASATLGSLGTTTTYLQGNAAGAPSFSQVSLSAGVTGILPLANGGTNGIQMTKTSGTVETIGSNCAASTPCIIGNGGINYVLTSSPTVTISGSSASGTVYWYLTPSLVLTAGHNTATTMTCSAGCTVATGITGFPAGSFPLWATTFTSNVWDAITGAMDNRAVYSLTSLTPGQSIVTSQDPSTGITTIQTDSTVVPRYFTGSGAPGITCTTGRDSYTDTANLNLYFCDAVNTWKQSSYASIPGTFTDTVWSAALNGSVNSGSAQTIYQNIQGTHYTANGVTGAVAVSGGSTIQGANGVFGVVQNSATGTNAVGVQGYAVSLVASAPVWGFNGLAKSTVGQATTLIGNEVDTNCNNAGDTCLGMSVGGNSAAQPGTAEAYTVNSLGTGVVWIDGFACQSGAAQTCLSVGLLGSGNNIPSQYISLFGRDSGGTLRVDTITADPNGNLTLGPSAGKSVVISTIPASAGAGGLYVCIDSSGVLYKKSSCP